jgi:hypothetical protein
VMPYEGVSPAGASREAPLASLDGVTATGHR